MQTGVKNFFVPERFLDNTKTSTVICYSNVTVQESVLTRTSTTLHCSQLRVIYTHSVNLHMYHKALRKVKGNENWQQ